MIYPKVNFTCCRSPKFFPVLVNAIYLRELVIQTTEIIYPFIYLHIRDQIHMIHFIYTHMHFYPYFMEELDDILV